MHWHGTSGKVVMYLFPEEQLYSLQQLKMNKGSPSPPCPIVNVLSAVKCGRKWGEIFCYCLY